MRVTSNSYRRSYLEGLQVVKTRQEHFVRQASSLKRVAKPSDAPGDAQQINAYRKEVTRLGGFLDVLRPLEQDSRTYDQTLSLVVGQLQSAFNQGSAATAPANQTPEARATFVQALEGIREQVLSLANLNSSGRYLFSGTATDTMPFTLDPITGVVTYNGNSDVMVAEAGPDRLLPRNIPGDGPFMGPNGVFDSLNELIQAVQLGDTTAITTALGRLSGGIQDVDVARSMNGSRLASMEHIRTSVSTRSAELIRSIGELEDADMAEVVSGLQLSETALQAVYGAFAMTGRNSLFNYIG